MPIFRILGGRTGRTHAFGSSRSDQDQRGGTLRKGALPQIPARLVHASVHIRRLSHGEVLVVLRRRLAGRAAGCSLDQAEFEIPVDYASISPAGDVCPDELWYEVINLDEAVARGIESVRFRVDADELPADEVTCTQRLHELEQYRFADSPDALWAFVGHTVMGGVWNETPAFGPKCTWPGITQTLSAVEITGGVETVRFVARSLDRSLSPSLNAAAWFRVDGQHLSSPGCIPE